MTCATPAEVAGSSKSRTAPYPVAVQGPAHGRHITVQSPREIDLVGEVPEAMKPRRIAINDDVFRPTIEQKMAA
jgi:hypothetical protein